MRDGLKPVLPYCIQFIYQLGGSLTESAANESNFNSVLEEKHKNIPPNQGIVSIVNYDYIVTE